MGGGFKAFWAACQVLFLEGEIIGCASCSHALPNCHALVKALKYRYACIAMQGQLNEVATVKVSDLHQQSREQGCKWEPNRLLQFLVDVLAWMRKCSGQRVAASVSHDSQALIASILPLHRLVLGPSQLLVQVTNQTST